MALDSQRQLTLRAVGTGAVLGVLTGVSNLYVGLKLGWSVGVVVTASIMGWGVWAIALRFRVLRSQPSILEANAMASTASAAGYSTGATLVSAMSAYLLVGGEHLPLWQLIAWVLAVALLGLFVALALKHRLLDTEKLPFPTGAAAAQTLRTLYATGHRASGAGTSHARALYWAMAVAALLMVLTSVMPFIQRVTGLPAWTAVPTSLPTPAMEAWVPALAVAGSYTFALKISLLEPAAGALVGRRVATSIFIGAVICFGMIAPQLRAAGLVPSGGYTDVVSWSVWPGTSMMIVAGLLGFWVRHKPVRGPAPAATESACVSQQAPRWWAPAGIATAGAGCVALQVVLFDIAAWIAVLAVLLSGALATVAARVTGETDINPVGPLGKVAQLASGPMVLLPGPNIIVASVSAGAAATAADLLTDLRSGQLLGAAPRPQFLAQLIGTCVGALTVVPVFRYVLVPDASALGSAAWPAPAARTWAAVAEVVVGGVGSIAPSALHASWIAAVVAVAIVLAERWRPKLANRLPSATGLGLAFVLPASSSISLFLGAMLAAGYCARWPGRSVLLVPIAAGLIAGESLLGTLVSLVAGLSA